MLVVEMMEMNRCIIKIDYHSIFIMEDGNMIVVVIGNEGNVLVHSHKISQGVVMDKIGNYEMYLVVDEVVEMDMSVMDVGVDWFEVVEVDIIEVQDPLWHKGFEYGVESHEVDNGMDPTRWEDPQEALMQGIGGTMERKMEVKDQDKTRVANLDIVVMEDLCMIAIEGQDRVMI